MWFFKKDRPLFPNIQQPNEYVKEIERLTFDKSLRWVVTNGIYELSTEDKDNNLLRLILKDDKLYLMVSDKDIFRMKEYNDIYDVTRMNFPIYLYKSYFNTR